VAPRHADAGRWIEATIAHITEWARLDDPGLVKIHRWGSAEGGVFLVMERLVGPALSPRTPWSVSTLTHAGAAFALALAAAHRARLVHDDLKPSHLFIEPGERAVVVDFALPSPFLDGRSMASPRWCAPEVLAGAPPSPGSDVYALAQCLWEACTGVHAFPLTTRGPGALVELAEQKQTVDGLSPDAVPRWGPLLYAATRLDPAKRPTMAAFADRWTS
jgi:serine/threonine protein kinase